MSARGNLIALLERAEAADRELDARIWLQQPEQEGYVFIAYSADWATWRDFGLGSDDITNPDSQVRGLVFRDETGTVQAFQSSPEYTASIDAALTLVPEGMFWMLAKGRVRPEEPLAGFSIMKPDDVDNPIGEAEGQSLAVAICLASLRAREAMQ